MADEEKEAEGTEPKKKKKPLLLIIIALVVLLGGGGAVYFLVLKKPAEDPAAMEGVVPEQQAAGAAAPRGISAETGPMQAYPSFTVNLADPGGQRYLKIGIALELSMDKDFSVEVTAKEAKIKDAILTVLSAKTLDEVSTTQGKVALKQEILRRLNTLMATGRIEEVYITEFMMQ
ncbi:MAG: flagellar basal body-associated FliL family protein [Deferribacteraceae bacterium]|jgi:flagellar FliL protein|nr:flagellar basal body-associated FliL family protein [Deferribacteraceae bacterium]